MFRDEFGIVCNGAKGKLNLLKNNPAGYVISAVMAGIFIAFGGFVMLTVGGNLGSSQKSKSSRNMRHL